MSLTHADYMDGRLFELRRTLRRGDDHGNRAVVHQRAVEQVERLADPTGGVIVLERDRLLHDRSGVSSRPLPVRDGYGAQVVARRPIEGHVPSGRQRVGRVRTEESVGCAQTGESARGAAGASIGCSSRTSVRERCVREHARNHVAHARLYGERGELHHLPRRRAGRVHVIHEPKVSEPHGGLQVERESARPRPTHSGDPTVDQKTVEVVLIKAGILEGSRDGSRGKGHGATGVVPCHLREAEANDCAGRAARGRHSVLL